MAICTGVTRTSLGILVSAFPLEKSKLGGKSGNNSDALLNTSILFLISTSVNPMEFLDSLGHGGLGYPKETVSVVGHALRHPRFLAEDNAEA